MLRRVVVLTLMLVLLTFGVAWATERQTPYLKLASTQMETYWLDTQPFQIRRFASGEMVYEAWVRTDFDKTAYLDNLELIKGSIAPQLYAAKLSHNMTLMYFSPRGRLASVEHISYGYDGTILCNWREEKPDWRDIVPGTPGAAMLTKISDYAVQEYDDPQPEKVLMDFLTWYVDGRTRSDEDKNIADPLMTYAYMNRAELTDNFKQHISAQMPRPGADPVLETQWIKEKMEIGTVVIQGDSARVAVYDYRQKMYYKQQTPLLYFLQRQDGRWLIDRVERETQWMVVEGFYKWYKDQLDKGQDPLAMRAYRQSPFLTREFKARLDAHVAAMNQGEEAYQFNPFLRGCELLKPHAGYPETFDNVSTMIVSLNDRLYEKGQPRLKVTMVMIDDRWKIDTIELEQQNR